MKGVEWWIKVRVSCKITKPIQDSEHSVVVGDLVRKVFWGGLP